MGRGEDRQVPVTRQETPTHFPTPVVPHHCASTTQGRSPGWRAHRDKAPAVFCICASYLQYHTQTAYTVLQVKIAGKDSAGEPGKQSSILESISRLCTPSSLASALAVTKNCRTHQVLRKCWPHFSYMSKDHRYDSCLSTHAKSKHAACHS